MLQKGLVYFNFNNVLFFVDENKKVVKRMDKVSGFPVKITEAGQIIASKIDGSIAQAGENNQLHWLNAQGELLRSTSFEHSQHHDFITCKNSIVLLTGKTVEYEDILLYDDRIIEVDYNGSVIWQWNCAEHMDEFCLTAIEKEGIKTAKQHKGGFDWAHLNAISLVGENKWHNQGDKRFYPSNIMVSSRQLSSSFIIDKTTGDIVWELGKINKLADGTAIIGQHHTHMIPKGLPGEGNILIFDNGGYAGYGYDELGKPAADVYKRDYTRIIEVDPISLEIVWEFSYYHLGIAEYQRYMFYSPFVGSVQRLPNGNTFITMGCNRRMIEVTQGHEIVWDYTFKPDTNLENGMLIYRAGKCRQEGSKK